MVDLPARAADPIPDGMQLPWGIHLGASGRYTQDLCDHSYSRYCLAKRLLPASYVPELVPATPRPRPLAGQYCNGGGGGGASSPPAGTMAPTDILTRYAIPTSSGAFGKIVAVVDMPDTHAFSDMNAYRTAFGIPPLVACPSGLPTGTCPCFAQVDESGNPTSPTSPTDGDCPSADGETSLDVEMISAACPDCSILLVQMTVAYASPNGPDDDDFAASAGVGGMLGAVATSISFGGEEYPGQNEGPGYTTPGHLVLAAAGDTGYLNGLEQGGGGAPGFPATAPDVLAVGGTTLVQLGAGSYGEKVWDDYDSQQPQYSTATGSGCSVAFPMPAYQTAFLSSHAGAFGTCTNRDSNDVSAAAEYFPTTGNGGIAEYDQGWQPVVGTSAASPMVAAIFTRLGVAVAVSNDFGFVYTHIAAFNDITGGTNAAPAQNCATTDVQCYAQTGWDGPTGVGTPNGAMLASLGTPNSSGCSGGIDAGTDSGSGSGSGSGGGSGSGSGSSSGGSTDDSGTGSSSGGSDDGGSGNNASPTAKSGCGCDTIGSARSTLDNLALLALGAGALVVVRRRRSRS
jgi:MYXO-CTERM domain-containing protein